MLAGHLCVYAHGLHAFQVVEGAVQEECVTLVIRSSSMEDGIGLEEDEKRRVVHDPVSMVSGIRGHALRRIFSQRNGDTGVYSSNGAEVARRQ